MISLSLYLLAMILLLLALVVGAFRVIASPALEDKMLAVQLLGSIGAAILLLWGQAFGISALFDVAIVLALLSAVSVAAMTRLAPKHD